MNGSRPIALVTGAVRTGRVGLETARQLAQAGCDLLITFRGEQPRNAREIAAVINTEGGHCRLERLELEDPAAVDSWAAEIARSLPRLDVLVHNASAYAKTPTATLSMAEAQKYFAINALSPLALSRSLSPLLAESPLKNGGAIVTMCDIHALGTAGQPRKDFIAYSMSKAALLEMTLVLARELAPRIRVNAVAPGVVAFPTEGHESDPESQHRYLTRVPLGRAGTPSEAAATVRWLALDAAYITGQVIRIDGGRTLT